MPAPLKLVALAAAVWCVLSPPASAAESTGILTSGPAGERRIALTLDDGFRPDPAVLDLTERLGVRGTAFLTGDAAIASPWLVDRLVEAGWEVCSHTQTHALLTGRSRQFVKDEVVRGARTIERLSGQRCDWFRPPAGAVDSNVRRVVADAGMQIVNWNASISDSTSPNTPVSVQVGIAMRDIAPGAILLGHFGGVNSAKVLEEVLTSIIDDGYEVGSVTELFHGARPWIGAEVVVEQAAARTVASPAVDPLASVPPGALAGAGYLVVGALMTAGAGVSTRRRRPDDPAPAEISVWPVVVDDDRPPRLSTTASSVPREAARPSS